MDGLKCLTSKPNNSFVNSKILNKVNLCWNILIKSHNLDEYFTQESIIVTSDSKYILYCSDSDSIQVIDIQTGKPIHQLKKVTDRNFVSFNYTSYFLESIGSFAVTPDNRYIIWSDGYQSIKMSEFHPNNEPQPNYIKAIAEKNQSEPKTPGSASKSTKIFDIKTREKEVTPSLNDNSRHLIKTPSLLNQEIYFGKFFFVFSAK